MIAGIVIALLVVATASTGALFTPGEWYESLRKPRWTPPNWLFPVVWTLLYAMIGIAGWLVWRAEGASLAMGFWIGQLALNAAWSWLFFGLRRMVLALLDLGLLVLAIVGFILTARTASYTAALLFLPYLAWVLTAGALNLRVLQMNPLEARRA